ncbi:MULTISPECIES: hypothetical protein [unclassified Halomonas]|uniref:hypothetical protein n=1 Tax=unclassified Halomonas TaxID=2609666 RepID=UPI0009905203|nr:MULTISPECIES: hypothetical protein [unclassified Halomonas]AQU83222.1 hypothetical protein B2G49_11995 [Halomonas sp. 'Soap Lake \
MSPKNIAKRKQSLSTLAGDATPRQRIWDAIRHQHADDGLITMQGIRIALKRQPDLTESRISDYLRALIAGGFLVRSNPDAPPATTAIYLLKRDVGAEAPRVRRDGSLPPPPGREQLWRTLKIIGTCTGQELADAASTVITPISRAAADEYLTMLSRAKYVKTIREGKPGVPARFQLVPSCWTGPMAPQIRRTKQLYDPNTGEVVYSRVTKTEGGEP